MPSYDEDHFCFDEKKVYGIEQSLQLLMILLGFVQNWFVVWRLFSSLTVTMTQLESLPNQRVGDHFDEEVFCPDQ